MFNNYGIEENRLSDEEVMDYANCIGNIDDNDDIEAILKIVEAYVDDYMGGDNW